MAKGNTESSIPFETLLEAIRQLGLRDKRRLCEMLKQEVTRAERELAQQDLTLRGEVRQMRDDHAPPDYLIPEE
jgi:hypothetical protein